MPLENENLNSEEESSEQDQTQIDMLDELIDLAEGTTTPEDGANENEENEEGSEEAGTDESQDSEEGAEEETSGDEETEGTKEESTDSEETSDDDSATDKGDSSDTETIDDEAGAADESGSDEDPRDAKITQLTALVEKLAGGQQVQPAQQAPTPEQTPVTEQTPNQPKPEVKPEAEPELPNGYNSFDQMVDNLDMDNVLASKENFVGVLKAVHDQATTRAMHTSVQQVLTSLPQIVMTQVRQNQTYVDLYNDFYNEHKDLTDLKNTVGMFANEVHSEHPDWGMKEVLTEAAKRTREHSGFKAAAESKVKSARKRKPTLPNTGKKGNRSRAQTPGLEGIEAEIDDLLDY